VPAANAVIANFAIFPHLSATMFLVFHAFELKEEKQMACSHGPQKLISMDRSAPIAHHNTWTRS
jgi:hypothetical protein